MLLTDHRDVLRIHAAAVQAGLANQRAALLTGLPREITSGLPSAADPSAQLLLDLDSLNVIHLRDGSAPLSIWLENAVALCGARMEADVFRAALAATAGSTAALTASGTPRSTSAPGLEWHGPWAQNPQINPEAPEVFRSLEDLQAWLFTDEAKRALGCGIEAIDSFGLGVAMREWMRREGLLVDPARDAATAPAWYAARPGKPRALCSFDWERQISASAGMRARARMRARAGAEEALVAVIALRKGDDQGTIQRDEATGVVVARLVYPAEMRREIPTSEPMSASSARPRWLPAGYVDEVKRRCDRLDPILVRQERVYHRRIEQAVELTLAYREESTAYPASALLHDPALTARDAVILGDAGSGKTTIARSLAARCTAPDAAWIPVYLPLGRYRAGELGTLLEQAGLGDCRSPGGTLDPARFAEGRFLFLLDGYDELGHPAAFWREIDRLRAPGTRTLVTGRFLSDLRHRLPGAAFLAVRPLGPSQIEEFISVFEGEATPGIVSWIRRRGLEREARRPLWLVFILLVLRLGKTVVTVSSEGPLPLGQIYRLLIEHYFLEGWEAVREGKPPEAPPAVVADYLAEVALHMGWYKELSFRRARLESLYEEKAKRATSLPFERFIEQVERHQLLLYEAGEYFFPHRSFQEYFAATGLLNHLTPGSLADHLDEHWKDTVRLLVGLLPAERAAGLFEQVEIAPPADRFTSDALNGFGRAEILAEVPGFSGTPESSLGPASRSLRRRVEQAIDGLAASMALRDAELALRLALLLPAGAALGHVTALHERSQDVGIEAIDVLGRIFIAEALDFALDRVMRSPDERILRRVADHVLVPHVCRSGAWSVQARLKIEARIRTPDGDRQARKRRWHLVHALMTAGGADPERMRTGDGDLDAVTAAYALSESRPREALEALVLQFEGSTRVTRAATTRALGQLLSSDDFYMRRTGAHFLRILDFDFTSLARRAIRDPAIEVRFSVLKGLIQLAHKWPARSAEALRWLTDAIDGHPAPEEEHFRQVALGVIKHINHRRFWPRALSALEREPVTFRVDIVHGLWDAEGLWAAAAVNALDRILVDPDEPERLRDDVREALAALTGRRVG